MPSSLVGAVQHWLSRQGEAKDDPSLGCWAMSRRHEETVWAGAERTLATQTRGRCAPAFLLSSGSHRPVSIHEKENGFWAILASATRQGPHCLGWGRKEEQASLTVHPSLRPRGLRTGGLAGLLRSGPQFNPRGAGQR